MVAVTPFSFHFGNKQSNIINIAFILFVTLISATAQAETLRVAVASNFAKPIERLSAEFNKTHPHKIQISSASSGVLYQQIRHGAPFDLFLSADLRRPQLLEEQGLILENYRNTYAIGQIAIWSAIAEEPVSLENLKHYDGRIALAAPHIAPYGLAAKQSLIKMDLWSKFHRQLITGNNINQTYQQILTGAVRYGFISHSQLLDSKHGFGTVIDSKLHKPLEQQMVVLKNAENIELATSFFNYLLTDEAQHLISTQGYERAPNIPRATEQSIDREELKKQKEKAPMDVANGKL
ncbi:molybdate ABC transporter substrate-binding protein [Thalassotalea crassostreae]|uniref:molybdate ABC transporter substrate-binding protein n=1 Tax=Thalassotalea crassostreae TaxID=1763536 RepID=UPI000838CFA0|nr:molybdate ABC transporter substrate-binding protein [Thalassotalea crassostreae]